MSQYLSTFGCSEFEILATLSYFNTSETCKLKPGCFIGQSDLGLHCFLTNYYLKLGKHSMLLCQLFPCRFPSFYIHHHFHQEIVSSLIQKIKSWDVDSWLFCFCYPYQLFFWYYILTKRRNVVFNLLWGIYLFRESSMVILICLLLMGVNMNLKQILWEWTPFWKVCIIQSHWKYINPFALRTAKTQWSYGCSDCNRVKV